MCSNVNKQRTCIKFCLVTIYYRINDIKEDLLKTIADVLIKILPSSPPIKEQPMVENQVKPEENIQNQMLFLPTNNGHVIPFEFLSMGNVHSVDNGDLAEADQSTREAENEEGAVGGIILPTTEGHNIQTNNCDVCF